MSYITTEYLTCTKRMSCGRLLLHLAIVLVEILKEEKSAGGGMLTCMEICRDTLNITFLTADIHTDVNHAHSSVASVLYI